MAESKAQTYTLISETAEWKALQKNSEELNSNKMHLKDLIMDANRYKSMYAEHDKIFLDFSRQRVTTTTMDLLFGK